MHLDMEQYGWVLNPEADRKKAISEIFGLPHHVHPVSIVSVGIPVKIPGKIPEDLNRKRSGETDGKDKR